MKPPAQLGGDPEAIEMTDENGRKNEGKRMEDRRRGEERSIEIFLGGRRQHRRPQDADAGRAMKAPASAAEKLHNLLPPLSFGHQ